MFGLYGVYNEKFILIFMKSKMQNFIMKPQLELENAMQLDMVM